jgi:hypothetical protein
MNIFDTPLKPVKSVAYILSGMLREWDQCVNSFTENFLEPNKSQDLEIDIYLVTYDVTDRYSSNRKVKEVIQQEEYDRLKKEYNCNNLKIVNFESFKNKNNFNTDYADNLVRIYQEHCGTDFKAPAFDGGDHKAAQQIFGAISMQTQIIKESFDFMKDNNKKYDCVVRSRFDLNFENKLLLPKMLYDHACYTLPMEGNQGFADQLFCGTSNTMEKIMLANNLLQYKNDLKIKYAEHLFMHAIGINEIMLIANESWDVSVLREAINGSPAQTADIVKRELKDGRQNGHHGWTQLTKKSLTRPNLINMVDLHSDFNFPDEAYIEGSWVKLSGPDDK